MALRLQLRARVEVPLEVDEVLPENLLGKGLGEIERTAILHGNRRAALADFFRVSGDPADECLEWEGDLSGVHWIGAKMRTGTIRVCGPAGRHVGSQMRGGAIDVAGDAGDWVGGEMLGGLIRVRGSAGHLVGAAYRGSARGMTGGTILVHGDAGNEIGHAMRRGLVAIGGNAGDLLGFNMLAGSIIVLGPAGMRIGAGMRRGTLGLFGDPRQVLLPTFRHACRRRMEVLRLFAATFRRHAFPWPNELAEVPVDLFNGDMLEGGRGELFVRVP